MPGDTTHVPLPDDSLPISDVKPLASIGNRLLLETGDEAHNIEPWISDGTAAGSYMLADIGVQDHDTILPWNLAYNNGLIYYRTNLGLTMVSDRDEPGSRSLADAFPESRASTVYACSNTW
ncbi:MAG: hypothetical protein R3C44_14330 [Chloroflexota bacterium]